MSKIDYDACMLFRSTLASLPSNKGKLYPGATIEQAIQRGKAEKRPTLSSLTQEAYLKALRDMLGMALKKGLISVNYVADLKPLTKDSIARKDKRLPLSNDQISSLMRSDFYMKAAKLDEPFRADEDGWRFWLPPIMALMGMRPNEICQLLVADVRPSDSGMWFVDVMDTGDEASDHKQLKTAFSRRRIPIHIEVLAIGFLTYVDVRRKQGVTRLFPTLKAGKDGNLAWYPVKRFGEQFLRKSVALAPRQSLYSLHHSFRDALRAVSAPPDVLQAIGGWSQNTLVSDNYGDNSKPEYTSEYVQKIAYPGVSFTHLHAKPKTTESSKIESN